MSSYLLKTFAILIVFCLGVAGSSTCEAKKIYSTNPGCVFLSSGDSIVAEGDLNLVIPAKKKKLELIENPYTKENRVSRRLAPAEVDSVRVWSLSAPEHPHTLVFNPRYGWCWEAEHGRHLSVYVYSPKGYYYTGNGGFWIRGKATIFIIKDGQRYDFGSPFKMMDNKIRKQIEQIVSDDPECLQYIREAKGRRDRIIRSLASYSPVK